MRLVVGSLLAAAAVVVVATVPASASCVAMAQYQGPLSGAVVVSVPTVNVADCAHGG